MVGCLVLHAAVLDSENVAGKLKRRWTLGKVGDRKDLGLLEVTTSIAGDRVLLLLVVVVVVVLQIEHRDVNGVLAVHALVTLMWDLQLVVVYVGLVTLRGNRCGCGRGLELKRRSNNVGILANVLNEGCVGWVTKQGLDEVSVTSVLVTQATIVVPEIVAFLGFDIKVTLELANVF